MFDQDTIILGGLIFLVAGLVKGLIGLGLPTVSLALLSLVVDIRIAIALMVVPSIITNIWQAFAGTRLKELTVRLAPMLFVAVVATWVASSFLLTRIDGALLSGFFGILLACYAAISLTTPQVPEPGKWEPVLGPVTGALAGTATGLTGSFVVPGVLYMQALNLGRDGLVQAMGIAFTIVLVALGGGLVQAKLMDGEIGLWSLSGLVPAAIGMWVGQKIRKRIPEKEFRTLFFVALLALGNYLALRAFL